MTIRSPHSIQLRFDAQGSFKILAISDIQECCAYDPRSFANIERLLDAERPDLVLLIGDNCNGPKITTEAELREYIALVAAPFETRGIPWAQVWGNHDHDVCLDKDLHQSLYMACPHNLSSSAPGVSGQSNFVLPILASASDAPVFCVWGLDSGPNVKLHRDAGIDPELHRAACALPHKVHPHQGVWGMVCFDQLMWYYNTSRAIEAEQGRKIPGMLAIHVPPYEICAITDNPEACGTVGDYPEFMNLGMFNSGLFATLLQRGDIRAICSGHSHNDTECGTYCGILLANDGSIGASCYGKPAYKGGRVFRLREEAPEAIETYFVRA